MSPLCRVVSMLILACILTVPGYAQDPTVSPFLLLPGDDEVSPALCNPNNPAIARGGDQFLVVWSDQRSKLGEAATEADVFGMRLDAAGNPLDPVPIAIGVTPSDDRNPKVCWNGSNWLVTWSTYGISGEYYGAYLDAARVSPSGTVLDNPAMVLIATSSSSLAGYTMGTNGSDWVVVTSGTTAGDVGVRGFRVSNAGVVRDPAGVLIPTTTPSYSVPPIGYITGANGQYLYIYTMWNSSDTTSDDVMAVRLASDLSPIGQPFYVSRNVGNENVAGVATDGSNYFVLFTKPGAQYFIIDLWGARVSTAGAVLDPAGINISRGNSPTAYNIASRIEWNGTHYVAMWAYNGLSVARVSAAGSLLDPGGVSIPSVTADQVAASVNGGYQTVSTNSYTVVTASAISPTYVIGVAKNLSTGAPSQYIGSLANNGTSWMLAFLSATSSGLAVKVQGLAADGSALSPEAITLGAGTATAIGRPKLAWNGSVYLVVWGDSAAGGIVGRRINAAGTPVDAAPFFIVAGGSPSVGALGATFLVAFTYGYYYHSTSAYAIRVDGVAGAPLGPTLYLGGAFSVTTSVTTVGNRWLAMWQQNLSHDNAQGSCLGVFVTPDGTLQNAFYLGGTGAYRKSPAAAVSDDTVLLVWAEGSHYLNYDIKARRMAFNGSFLDDAAFVVSNPYYSQYSPAVAWNGDEFVIAFNDGRNRTTILEVVDARSDVYGARVTEAGAVLDPNGFPIAAEPVQEQFPEVGVLNGDTMFSASIFIPQASYAGYRLGTAYLYGAPGPDLPPVTALQAVPTQGVAPLVVQFSSTGSYDPEAGPLTYAWTFGDGSSSTAGAPAHTYAAVGSYTATLTVTDSQGLTDSKSVTINALQPNRPPVLVAACTPLSGTAPLTITVDNTGSYDPDGGTFSYWWDFGNGQGIAAPSGTHTYSTTGTYTVTATLTDPQGATASKSFTVTVNPTVKTLRSTDITLSGMRILNWVSITGKVTVRDQANALVSGAAVAIKWTLPNGTMKTASATTNSSGVAGFSTSNGRGTYNLTVTNITKMGYAFNSAGSIRTKSITK